MWPGSASECDSGATHYGGASAVDLHHASHFSPPASAPAGVGGEKDALDNRLYRRVGRRSTGRARAIALSRSVEVQTPSAVFLAVSRVEQRGREWIAHG